MSHQICSGQPNLATNCDLWKGVSDVNSWVIPTDAEIEECRILYQTIRSIRSEAVADMISVIKEKRSIKPERFIAVIYTELIVSEDTVTVCLDQLIN